MLMDNPLPTQTSDSSDKSSTYSPPSPSASCDQSHPSSSPPCPCAIKTLVVSSPTPFWPTQVPTISSWPFHQPSFASPSFANTSSVRNPIFFLLRCLNVSHTQFVVGYSLAFIFLMLFCFSIGVSQISFLTFLFIFPKQIGAIVIFFSPFHSAFVFSFVALVIEQQMPQLLFA